MSIVRVLDQDVFETFDKKRFLTEAEANAHHLALQEKRKANCCYFLVVDKTHYRRAYIYIAVEIEDEETAVCVLLQYLFEKHGKLIDTTCNNYRANFNWGKIDHDGYLYRRHEDYSNVFLSLFGIPIEGFPEPTKLKV